MSAYPTREQAADMTRCVEHPSCDRCSVESVCDDYADRMLVGRTWLAMHDALDAKQAEIDALNEMVAVHVKAINAARDEIDRLRAEVERLTPKERIAQNGCTPCQFRKYRRCMIAGLSVRGSQNVSPSWCPLKTKPCAFCRKQRTMDCPNSAECAATNDRPHWDPRK